MIQVQGISVWRDQRRVLDEISLELRQGEKLTLTGPSGCGKSTLIQCLLGFVTPRAGQILIGGQALDARSAWPLRHLMAWVSQEPQLANSSARQALLAPFQYAANRALQPSEGKITGWCERFLLARELLEKPVSELSGGEKQRVALISALLLERPILLLDEAASALDPASRAAVARCLAADPSLTILSVAHDPELFALGGRIMKLEKDGRLHLLQKAGA